MEIIKIIDGEVVDDNIVDKFNLRSFCSLNSLGEYTSKFVGVIINKNELLISCPKHFKYNDENDIQLIIECLFKVQNSRGVDDKDIIESNFPLNSYLYVVDYFEKYGLYREKQKTYFEGYKGKIQWNKVFRKSQKIFNNDNLIFFPFIIKESIPKDVFITECMKFVINDGYEKIGQYFNVGVLLEKNHFEINTENINAVIDKLLDEKNSHFKDIDITLINEIIKYMEWKNNTSKQLYFVTKNFDIVWEKMINNYLSNNYVDYDSNTKRILFYNNCGKFKFHKKREYIQSKDIMEKNKHKATVEYDHYIKKDSTVMIFDSKYYNEINDTNYKQVAYYYFLKNRKIKNETPDYIINGLIIPHSGSYYTKIHLDRTDIDGLLIVEHYLNIREVMEAYR